MNNKDIFLERAKEYFGNNYEKFVSKLNEKQTHGFILNLKKGNERDLLSHIDFEYEKYNCNAFRHGNLSIGKSYAHELGLIYSQGLEASEPCLLPDIKDTKIVLDMCASPGGKSINILNRVSNDTIVIANEYEYKRVQALNSNLERLGYENVIITNKKTSELSKELYASVDLVILDAPCSGEGMIRKYPEILNDYSVKNINSLAELQASLLEDAYKCLKPNGQLLYSTCTYSFEEDEDQVNSFLSKHKDMRIINSPKKLSVIDETEGQFMVLFKKDATGSVNKIKYLDNISNKLIDNFIKENIIVDSYYLYRHNDNFYLSLIPLINMGNNVIRYGLDLGSLKKDRFEPSHCLYRSNLLEFKTVYDLSDKEYELFIKGNELPVDLKDNYYQVRYKGFALGYGKVSNNRLKNKYPKGLRKMI